MNLKAKLCILKKYTLLLVGPSPFELWCESCPCFTVRPLSFLLFTTGSSVFLLEFPSSPVPLPCARVFCRRPPPSTCSSAPLAHASSYRSFHRPCHLRSARDHSLLLSLSLPSAKSCLPYKTKLSSFSLLFLPLSPSLRPLAPNRRHTIPAGILLNRTTPPKFH
jgi:hypothetical protein